MATLPELLRTTVDTGSLGPPPVDRHAAAGPRRTASCVRLDQPPLTPTDSKALTYSVLTDAQKKRFEETLELDFSFGIRGLARFRCNMYNQRGAVAAAYRQIPGADSRLR